MTILGFANPGRDEAPLHDGSEVWGLNQLYQLYQDNLAWTRWFEMHDFDFLKKWNPGYVDWLKAQRRGPIYMQKRQRTIPMSEEYPRDAVNATLYRRFGTPPDYFTSTFSYMMALALHERFEAVGIYGVNLIQDGEADYERPGIEYLIGIAQGAGVSVRIATASPLLKIHYVYGYREPRMRLSDVQPIIDFMRYSEGISQDSIRALGRILDNETDPKQRGEIVAETWAVEGQRRAFRDIAWWLKHYGRGGCLIGPDNNLAKE